MRGYGEMMHEPNGLVESRSSQTRQPPERTLANPKPLLIKWTCQIDKRRGGVVLKNALLFFLLLTSHRAFAGDIVAVEPSLRISTCGYVIGFPRYDDHLSEAAKDVIADAAREANRNGNNTITLSGHRDKFESRNLAQKRVEAVKNEIMQTNLFRGTMSAVEPTDDPPDKSQAYIFVCHTANNDDAGHVPPEHPDRRVSFVLGSVTIAVPLRHLDPIFWYDTPIVPKKTDSLRLSLDWPASNDHPSTASRQCVVDQAAPCSDQMVVNLTRSYSVPVDPPSPRNFLYPKLVRLPGVLHGLAFFVYRDIKSPVVFMEGKTRQGTVVRGQCSLDFSPIGEKISTLLEIAQHLNSNSTCGLSHFSVGADLVASVDLEGDRLNEWESVYQSIVRLILDYQTAADGHINKTK